MVNGSPFRTKSRRLAMILLLVFGSIIILFGLFVLSAGLAITHNDSFRNTFDLKVEIDTTLDYVQYWIGLPYIFAGVSVACSAVNLRRVALTVCTIFLSLICVVLSLGGLVVDGPDFVFWKDIRARQRYWEGQDGFACSSDGGNCTCKNAQPASVSITSITDCETLSKISALYGILIGSFIVGLVLLLASVFVIVYIIAIRRAKGKREERNDYDVSKKMKAEHSSFEMNPIYDVPLRENTNRGYEQPVKASEETVRYTEYKRKVPDDSSKVPESESEDEHKDDSSIVDNGGEIMMDPGRFRQGDDDIY